MLQFILGRAATGRTFTVMEKIKKDENDSLSSVIKLSSETNIIINNDKYLTITALEDDLTVSLSLNPCQYSLNGTEWVELQADEQTPAISSGKKIYFKAEGLTPSGKDGIGTFIVSKRFNLSGNCMSMLFGDEAEGKTDLTGYDYAFLTLFMSTPVVNVSSNFLPATTLVDECYYGMFYGCTSLVQAPELPATTLANNCYSKMFNGCTSLVNIPELPATELTEDCYYGMFNGCTSLVTAPELPAKTLAEECYQSMFQGCKSLVTAPELPATTLANNCYNAMFNGCTLLVQAPELPATTLADYCYSTMFQGCKLLLQAPELPATTLVGGCYRSMFQGCTSLKYIKMLATDISATNCLSNWVNGVSLTGTFVRSEDATWIETGDNGIPEGWNILPYTPLTITALEDDTEISFSNNCEISLDNKKWRLYTKDTNINISNGGKVYFRGNLKNESVNVGIGTFTVSKPFDLSGTVMSMLFGDEAEGKTDLTGYAHAFIYLFSKTPVVNVSSDFLPATTLANNCYSYMFQDCTSLVNAPELPATTLANYCYNSMFNGCTSLSNAPELPATTLAEVCYSGMFGECTSLVNAPELPATTLASSCYAGMFGGCTSLVNAPELPATTLVDYCYQSMFYGCTSLVNAPELPATELTDDCYVNMFAYCKSLVNAPELPATTLTNECYKQMFWNCTSLVNAPELPATTLTNECYSNMFCGCTSLVTAPELPATELTNA